MLANNGGFKHLVFPLKGVTFVASGGQESEKHRLQPLDRMSIPVSNHSSQVLMISARNVPRLWNGIRHSLISEEMPYWRAWAGHPELL